jgi:hypothetical protein
MQNYKECIWEHSTDGLRLYWILATVTEWHLSKRPMQCCHYVIYCMSHLSFNNRSLWLQQRHLVSKRAEIERQMSAEICLLVSLPCLKGLLTCRKILRHGADGFTSPLKSCYGYLSPLKYYPSPQGLNPWNLDPMASTINIKLQRMITPLDNTVLQR